MMAADVIVVASTKPEAFCRVVLEALSLGRRVVAVDQGGIGEILATGGAAFAGLTHKAQPGDRVSLLNATRGALRASRHGGNGESERQAAIKAARQLGDVNLMSKRTLEVYRSVFKGNSGD
mmetsp:Transcript_22795/g.53873  ORF Transcript_22795/g.53873 Transcript_22795/m.53873 type:complete len:121 (+) Transcript_22795:70-432(+)